MEKIIFHTFGDLQGKYNTIKEVEFKQDKNHTKGHIAKKENSKSGMVCHLEMWSRQRNGTKT